MIIGTIEQRADMLIAKETDIAHQYAENLKLSVNYIDNYFDGYSFVWLYTFDRDLKQTHILEYDANDKSLALPEGAFAKEGALYISARAISESTIITTSVVEFHINKSLDPKAINTPQEQGWEEVVHDLQQQFFDNEVMPKIQTLIDEAINQQKVVEDQQTESKRLQIEINTAVESCGKYTFENQTLRFQQADGTFGDPIHLEGQSTVFLDDAAQNMELKTIRAPNLEKIKVQMIVDDKNVLVETTADQIYVSDDLKLDEVLGGNMFFLEQNDSYLGLGNYEEWIKKGKPKA